MLSGVCIGTNNLYEAGKFYDELLSVIEMRRIVSEEHELGYGGADGRVTFWVVIPFNEEVATNGNGTQVMFLTSSKDAVHKFYETALAMGGSDEGAPGPRSYAEGYYGCYVRDPDGNKLHLAISLE